jgi:hypothetical protein
MVAALAIGVVVLYLIMKNRNPYVLIPMIFVLLITIRAMFKNLVFFLNDKNYTLVVISILIIILTVWLLFSGI